MSNDEAYKFTKAVDFLSEAGVSKKAMLFAAQGYWPAVQLIAHKLGIGFEINNNNQDVMDGFADLLLDLSYDLDWLRGCVNLEEGQKLESALW